MSQNARGKKRLDHLEDIKRIHQRFEQQKERYLPSHVEDSLVKNIKRAQSLPKFNDDIAEYCHCASKRQQME